MNNFDADPDVVTDILQLAPTRVWRAGELTLAGRPSKSNHWQHDVHPEAVRSGGEHDAALDALISLMEPRTARFARLRAELRPERVCVYGGFYFALDEQAGLWLRPDQMKVLAACGIEWGLDLFAHEV